MKKQPAVGRKTYRFTVLNHPFSKIWFTWRLGVLAVGVFLSSAAVFAQTSQSFYSPAGQLDSIDNASFSARAVALGSAFTGLADDAGALFSNPAGLAWLRQGEITLNTHLGLVDTLQETLVLGLPLGEGGTLGFAASYLDEGTMEGRDNLGSLAANYGSDRIGLQAGWGGRIGRDFSLGASLKVFQQTTAGIGTSFLAPEAGLLWRPVERLQLGLDYAANGWGSLPGTLDSFLRAGFSYWIPLDPSFQIRGVMDNSLELNSLDYLQAGVEASWKSQYFLRAGYRVPFTPTDYGGFSGFSFGAGVSFAGFILDYAYSPYGDLGDTHRFSLTYPFGAKENNPGSVNTSRQPLVATPSPGLGSIPGKKQGNAAGATGPLQGVTHSIPGLASNSKAISGISADPGLGASASNSSSSNPYASGGTATVPSLPGNAAWAGPQPAEAAGNTEASLHVEFQAAPDFKEQADSLVRQGRYSQAVSLYLQALQQDDQDSQVWRSLGVCYVRLGQKKDAVSCLEKALALRPDDQALRDWLMRYKAQNP